MPFALFFLFLFACLILGFCLPSDATSVISNEPATMQGSNEDASMLSSSDMRSSNPRKVITYRQLGNNGRLGNQLFQMAACVGFAKKNNLQVQFPPWKYDAMFPNSHKYYQENTVFQTNLVTLNETTAFTFTNHTNWGTVSDIQGYRQHVKYFDFIDSDIRDMFAFSPKLLASIKVEHGTIGLHVRRGDYLNPNHFPVHGVCTKEYYLNGVAFIRRLHSNARVIIITDDKKWCETELVPQIPNSSISPYTSEQEDMVCLSLCSFKIISNSTFAWWAAWLDNRATSRVIAPTPWIKKQPNDDWKMLYLPNWHVYDVSTNTFI